jgi:23S rRNA (pseudouridine1915-N3)-methyltransferase
MRITICEVGRLRRSPHRELFETYVKLFRARAPQAGITEFRFIEIDDRKSPTGEAGRAWQAQRLLQKAPESSLVIAMDEAGKSYSSDDFAQIVRGWRDEGTRDLTFMIGGPFGHGEEVLSRAHFIWALGPATWPHELVPIMVAEQLYRSICILTGHPYHHGSRPKINK